MSGNVDERPDWGEMQRDLLAAKLRAAWRPAGLGVDEADFQLRVFDASPDIRHDWRRIADVAIAEIQGG